MVKSREFSQGRVRWARRPMESGRAVASCKGRNKGDDPPQNKHKKTNEFAIFFIHGFALKLVYLLQLILVTTCIHCKTILDHFSMFFNCFIGACVWLFCLSCWQGRSMPLTITVIGIIYVCQCTSSQLWFFAPIEYGFGVREPGRVDIAGAPQLCFLFYDPPLNIEY
jgi:hypothetical protein